LNWGNNYKAGLKQGNEWGIKFLSGHN